MSPSVTTTPGGRPARWRGPRSFWTPHPRLGLIAASTLVGPKETADPIDALLAASLLGTAADLPGPSVLGFLACASVVRLSALREVDGFRPLLHFGAEETLLALDLDAAGWGVAHCAEVVAHHHPDPGPRPGRNARIRRNELLTAVLRRPWPRVGEQASRLARDAVRDRAAAAALLSALPRLPAALLLRRPLPARTEHAVRLLEAEGKPAGD